MKIKIKLINFFLITIFILQCNSNVISDINIKNTKNILKAALINNLYWGDWPFAMNSLKLNKKYPIRIINKKINNCIYIQFLFTYREFTDIVYKLKFNKNNECINVEETGLDRLEKNIKDKIKIKQYYKKDYIIFKDTSPVYLKISKDTYEDFIFDIEFNIKALFENAYNISSGKYKVLINKFNIFDNNLYVFYKINDDYYISLIRNHFNDDREIYTDEGHSCKYQKLNSGKYKLIKAGSRYYAHDKTIERILKDHIEIKINCDEKY